MNAIHWLCVQTQQVCQIMTHGWHWWIIQLAGFEAFFYCLSSITLWIYSDAFRIKPWNRRLIMMPKTAYSSMYIVRRLSWDIMETLFVSVSCHLEQALRYFPTFRPILCHHFAQLTYFLWLIIHKWLSIRAQISMQGMCIKHRVHAWSSCDTGRQQSLW